MKQYTLKQIEKKHTFSDRTTARRRAFIEKQERLENSMKSARALSESIYNHIQHEIETYNLVNTVYFNSFDEWKEDQTGQNMLSVKKMLWKATANMFTPKTTNKKTGEKITGAPLKYAYTLIEHYNLFDECINETIMILCERAGDPEYITNSFSILLYKCAYLAIKRVYNFYIADRAGIDRARRDSITGEAIREEDQQNRIDKTVFSDPEKMLLERDLIKFVANDKKDIFILMMIVQDKTVSEIARALNISRQAIHKRIRNARENMRLYMQDCATDQKIIDYMETIKARRAYLENEKLYISDDDILHAYKAGKYTQKINYIKA